MKLIKFYYAVQMDLRRPTLSRFQSGRLDRDTRRIRCGDGFRSRAEVYLHADPTEKLEALSAVMPLGLKPGRFRAPDKLMAMLSTPGRKPKYAE